MVHNIELNFQFNNYFKRKLDNSWKRKIFQFYDKPSSPLSVFYSLQINRTYFKSN